MRTADQTTCSGCLIIDAVAGSWELGTPFQRVLVWVGVDVRVPFLPSSPRQLPPVPIAFSSVSFVGSASEHFLSLSKSSLGHLTPG